MTLPKDVADRLRLEAGDRILAVETDRGILLTPDDPEAERALKIAARAAKNIATPFENSRSNRPPGADPDVNTNQEDENREG